ncbi:MAG: hypothetical protein HY934_08190 [Candidatus Firestonebacteria bacterium]|nr:hypothetical protein [Candidatus Firestonebacteria bacterium]
MKNLKIALWIAGISCLIAIPFLFLPWSFIENVYKWFGQNPIPNIPTAVSLFRISCGIFGLIGVFFIILALNPLNYGPMLSLGAYGLILFGLLCLINGIILKISPVFYTLKPLFSLILGSIIIIFYKRVMSSELKNNTNNN